MKTACWATTLAAAIAWSAPAWSATAAKAPPEAAAKMAVQPGDTASGKPLVQLAILLDTSNSMDGMIKQAQTQLWAIVNEFATAARDGKKPVLQVALYQYGTPALGADNGYIRQVLPLTDDLDKVSEELFKLTTNGGDEYCGWVIQNAARDLKWSPDARDYKAIFIAGNEPFNQGKVDFHASCKEAVTRGIIVNTIHCAGAEDTFWADGARLADGQFMRIDGNRAVAEPAAPQDAEIARLNGALNATYIAYGRHGAEAAARQAAADSASLSRGSFSSRAASKANAQYRNGSWDMVDALAEKTVKLEDLKEEDLPENMRKMTPDERKAYVAAREKERREIQDQINKLTRARGEFITAELKKNAGSDTLGEQIRGAVRKQSEKQGFTFK